MKRILLLAVSATLLFSYNAGAQLPGVNKVKKVLPKLDLGVKVGANFQQLSGKNVAQNYAGGVVGGIFVGLHKNRMGVQAEALVKTAKYTVDMGTPIGYNLPLKYSVNMLELEVPVLFEYKVFWHIWAQAGPQFSSILSAKNGSTDYKNTFNSSEFSAVIGLEAHLPMRLNVGARYIYGITNINNEKISGVDGSMKNRTIQAYVGFRII